MSYRIFVAREDGEYKTISAAVEAANAYIAAGGSRADVIVMGDVDAGDSYTVSSGVNIYQLDGTRLNTQYVGPGEDLQAAVSAAAARYGATGVEQTIVAHERANASSLTSVPAGVRLVRANDGAQYHRYRGFRDNVHKEQFPLHYPSLVVYRVDDPAQSGGGVTDWWTTPTSTLADPLFNNANSSPLDYAWRRGIVISFGQVSGRIGYQDASYRYFSRSELQQLVWLGHEICSHSVTHSAVDATSLITETLLSKAQIDDALADASNKASRSGWTVNYAVCDECRSFIIPGAWSSSYSQVETDTVSADTLADWIMRGAYDTVQRWHQSSTPISGGAAASQYYLDWSIALNPASGWDAAVSKVLSRARTPRVLVVIAHHGPTINYGTNTVPSTAQWKTLVDALYDLQRNNYAAVVPMRAAYRAQPIATGDMFRGGVPHGLFDCTDAEAPNMDFDYGMTRTATGDGRVDFVANSSFWTPNTLHSYTQGQVARLYWAGTTTGSAQLRWQLQLAPGARYCLRFDYIAPSNNNGQSFYVTLSQWRERSGGTDSWRRIVEFYVMPTATNSWQTLFAPFYVHPLARDVLIAISANYGSRIVDKGVAISNVQCYRIG
jgi:hypothetical protein